MHEIEPGKWVVSGMMSLRQLGRRLATEIPESQSVTVGGVIQEEMQRLAQKGDWCNWGSFRFIVIESPERGNMIVELTLRNPDEDDAIESGSVSRGPQS